MAETSPIAIVGIALRAPGDGSDPERFWQVSNDDTMRNSA